MNRREAGMLFFGVMFGALLSIVLGIVMEPKLPKPDQPIMTQDTSHWIIRKLSDGSVWMGPPETYAARFIPDTRSSKCFGNYCWETTAPTENYCFGPKCDELKKARGGK